MMKMHIEAPWYTFQKKVQALFNGDPDITVNDLVVDEDGEADYVLDIEVRNHKKFEALDRVIATYKEFGNIVVKIALYDEENNGLNPGVELYETIFEGNPVIEAVKNRVFPDGVSHGYVCFKPEVVQFFDDNLSDYNGNWTGLAEDIAREIFENDSTGMQFCTAAIDKVEVPLGEWP